MEKPIKAGIDKAIADLIKNGCQPEFKTDAAKVEPKKAGEAWGTTSETTADTSANYVHTTINSCCVCIAACNHTGPHQFCAVHGANLQTPAIVVNPPVNPATPPLNLGLTGWKCPVCGTGVSPYATTCPNHNSGNQSPFQIQPWPWNPNQFFD